ncbi:hypothetical protein HD554DRAFT_2172207 [Boletus coccyginus]|nr:hypothetical protein HD554DRAFT_2172207 [Boletus coccyginus]
MDGREQPPSTWFYDDGPMKVHDASGDPKTAEELLKQMLLAIGIIETKWGVLQFFSFLLTFTFSAFLAEYIVSLDSRRQHGT